MSTIAETNDGILQYNQTNELLNDSKIEDPSAYRGGAPLGGSLVKWSGDRLVGSMRLERTLIIFKEVNGSGGQIEIFCQQPGVNGDAGMKRLMTLDTTGIQFHVPAASADRLISSNGQFEAIVQNDSNFVVYNRQTGAPVWSWMTGPL